MELALGPGLIPTKRTDDEMRQLADRHYNRETRGAREFVGPARTLILRDAPGEVLFAWIFPRDGMRLDGQIGFNCVVFRNESRRLSSSIVLEAEQLAIAKWGPNRMYTYVNPAKIKSRNPGYCFKVAGWRFVGLSKKGLHLLVKHG